MDVLPTYPTAYLPTILPTYQSTYLPASREQCAQKQIKSLRGPTAEASLFYIELVSKSCYSMSAGIFGKQNNRSKNYFHLSTVSSLYPGDLILRSISFKGPSTLIQKSKILSPHPYPSLQFVIFRSPCTSFYYVRVFFPVSKSKMCVKPFFAFYQGQKITFMHTFLQLFAGGSNFSRAHLRIFSRMALYFLGEDIYF